jgi:hypothetical protein
MTDAAADAYFKAVADERGRAIRAKEISDKTELITLTLPKYAQFATKYGIKVQVTISGKAALNDANTSNAIENQSATAVMDAADPTAKETAKALLEAKVPTIGIHCPGLTQDGSIPRFNNATRNNVEGFEGFLTMVANATNKTLNTPEGRFNAGAREGTKIGLGLIGKNVNESEDNANDALTRLQNLAGVYGPLAKLRMVLADPQSSPTDIGKAVNAVVTVTPAPYKLRGAKSENALNLLLDDFVIQSLASRGKISKLDGNKMYANLSSFIGTALLISLSKGNITEKDMVNYIPLRNVLAQSFMAGNSLDDMRKDVMNQRPKEKDSADAVTLRGFIGDGKTVVEVAGSIQNKFDSHAMVFGTEALDPEYLSLAARALLVPLYQNLNKFDISDEVGKNAAIQMQLVESVLQAG